MKLTFETEKLTVDWISFRFQSLDQFQRRKLAIYFLHLGFNSFKEFGKLSKPLKELMYKKRNNQFELLFTLEAPFWSGSMLHFSGVNATHFYRLVQNKVIDWEILSEGILSRVDLCYERLQQKTDNNSVSEFFQKCFSDFQQKRRKVVLERNSRGEILKFGHRKSQHQVRIYPKQNRLRFEYEITGNKRFLKDSHDFLVNNQLEEFENKLSNQYFLYLGKLLPLRFCYMDWLAQKLRPIRKQLLPIEFIATDYLQVKQFEFDFDSQQLISFLQLLVFIQWLEYQTESLGDTDYRIITFKVQDFLRFQKKSNNYYQYKKIITFLKNLRRNTHLTFFSRSKFQYLAVVPKVEIVKTKTCDVIQIWFVEELFGYQYPYFLPDFFREKNTKDELAVRMQMLKVFSSIEVEKKFYLKEFFKQYKGKISNQRISNMKQNFVELVKLLQDYDLIEDRYQVLVKGHFINVLELKVHDLSEGFVLFERILPSGFE